MIELAKKYRLLLIAIILILCSIFVESPYHGDYYGEPPYFSYFIITLVNINIYLFPTKKLSGSEKIMYSLMICWLVLITDGIFIENVLGSIYGYDPYYYELQTSPLLTNFLFWSLTNLTGIGIFAVWLKFKKEVSI